MKWILRPGSKEEEVFNKKYNEEIDSLGPIEDVNDVTWKFFYKKHLVFSTVVIFVPIILVLYLYFAHKIIHPLIFMPPVVLIFSWFWYAKMIVFEEFMKQFAKSKKLSYTRILPLDSVSGRLFENGHSKIIKNAVSGIYESHPMRIFNYQYTIGAGRSSQTLFFTIFEIQFEKTIFPHILLQSKSMLNFNVMNKLNNTKDSEISLSNQAKENFRLYTTSGYEIETLQIFTEETLELLRQKSSKFSIEFAENRMYIYDDLFISKKSSLLELYEIAQLIFDSIGPLLNRLHDDFAVLHPYYKDAE